MCQEPTELLLIGCLTGLTWIPRFKLGTSTTNISLQTYWRKEIPHAMSGTIFLICSTSAISALSAVPRISAWSAAPKRWRRGCKNTKKITGLWQNQGQRRWTWPSLSRQVPHPIASNRPGILKASTGKPDARARRNSKPDAASSSQARLKDAYLGGLMIKWFSESRYLKDLDRIDEEPMEVKWKISQDSLHWEFSLRFKRWWRNQSVNLSKSKEGSSSCQCSVTLYGENEETERIFFIANSVKIRGYAWKFPQGRWSFLGPGCEKKRSGTHTDKPDGEWDRTAESMMLNFAESGHPVFRSTSAWKEEN